MAEQKCSTVFFKCKSTSATTVAIEQHLNKNPNVSQLRIDTPEGVIECFSQAQHGLVIFEIHDKNELVDATNILAGRVRYIKAGLIRVVGYCYLQNSKIEYFLMRSLH